MNPVTIVPCKEPWRFWWILKLVRAEYPPDLFLVSVDDIKEIWELEGIPPLFERDWIELAKLALQDTDRFDEEQIETIWRQVYRIATARIHYELR